MAGSVTRGALSLACAAMLAAPAGCAYSFTGNLPGHLSTVRVAQFRSSVQEYGLEQELNSLFVSELIQGGRLSVVTESPDALVECQVTGFFRTPYSFSASEEIEEYKLEMRVSLDFSDLVTDQSILDDEPVDEWIVYDPDLEEYSTAKQRLLGIVAEEMARRCISGW